MKFCLLLGCFEVDKFQAKWTVDKTNRVVNVVLRTTERENWVAFGISNDRGMVGSF